MLFSSRMVAQNDLRVVKAKVTEVYEGDHAEIEMEGCCGGFSGKNVKASSTLAGNGDISYGVENLGDNNKNTAWVEGQKDDGVGATIEFDYEYDIKYADNVEYAFRYQDSWNILNGLHKTQALWQANNRVKRLKVYLNGVAFCYVDLLDEMGVQEFDMSFFDYLDAEAGTVHVKLEIVSVYKGSKWSDTAISQLYW